MTKITTNSVRYEAQLNQLIEYIHNHLDEKMDIKQLAEQSHFSPYHFHRITRALLGEPIGAYITRTRVETAAKMIRYTDLNIEEVAYNVGFEVPSSLSKAFKNHFGISPSDYRKRKTYTLKPKSMASISLNIKAPKIVTLEPQSCIYYRMHGPYKTLDYGKAWETLWAVVKSQKLFTKGIQSFGLPHDDPGVTDSEKIRYDACLTIHKPAKATDQVGVKTLEGGKYAMFLYQGPYTYFEQVYDYMFNDWLMEQSYELRDAPVRERYISHPERVAPEKLKTEFYLPIQ